MGEGPLDYPATGFGMWGRLPVLEASPKGSSFETGGPNSHLIPY